MFPNPFSPCSSRNRPASCQNAFSSSVYFFDSSTDRPSQYIAIGPEVALSICCAAEKISVTNFRLSAKCSNNRFVIVGSNSNPNAFHVTEKRNQVLTLRMLLSHNCIRANKLSYPATFFISYLIIGYHLLLFKPCTACEKMGGIWETSFGGET